MQITLNQDEIHAAVEAYVRQQVAIQPTQSLTIDFTMGRTPNGLTAALDIRAAVAPVVKPAVTRAKGEVTPAPAAEPEAAVEEEADLGSDETEAEAPAEEAPAKTSPFKKLNTAPATEEAEGETDESTEAAPATRPSIFSKKVG